MKTIQAINGTLFLNQTEVPICLEGHVLVETYYSAISPGTELSMAETSDDTPINIGYSASGRIVEVGSKVSHFKVGDRVAVYGAPYVGHREVLSVPQTLTSRVPDTVSLRHAAMAGLGAIAIHGLRQAKMQFGEVCVVVGLGIYGQLIAQIAKNAGMVVLGLNRSETRAALLEDVSGVPCYTDEQELLKAVMKLTNGKGADAAFLCAGGKVSPLTNQSMTWLRDRGTSVIVGDIEPVYDRELMFGKEITIKISRAGGPGRYDSSYELDAVDYPYGYVRWTEGRNVEEYIRLLDSQRINVSQYIDAPTSIDKFREAYEVLSKPGSKYLSHLFDYGKEG